MKVQGKVFYQDVSREEIKTLLKHLQAAYGSIGVTVFISGTLEDTAGNLAFLRDNKINLQQFFNPAFNSRKYIPVDLQYSTELLAIPVNENLSYVTVEVK